MADQSEGVWVAYGTDYSHHWSTTVFASELAARRYAMENYLDVGFLHFGDALGTVRETADRG